MQYLHRRMQTSVLNSRKPPEECQAAVLSEAEIKSERKRTLPGDALPVTEQNRDLTCEIMPEGLICCSGNPPLNRPLSFCHQQFPHGDMRNSLARNLPATFHR